MNFQKEEFDALNAERRLADIGRNRFRLELLNQAEVKAKHLTGDPHWDMFLSYIQGAIETTQRQLEGFEAALGSPDLVNTDEIMKAKISVIRCRERIAAWVAVMELPNELRAGGVEARGLLERLNDADIGLEPQTA